jgi:16S rRNA (guanine966-N2)-methyltransferase
VRVVGGIWKGHPLEAPQGRSVTRPTTDRVREALASMMESAFGIEMLSRGMEEATFIDQDRKAAARIKRNLAAVGAGREQVHVISLATATAIARGSLPGAPFDAVFLDPPYKMPAEEVAGLVDQARKQGMLKEGCLVLYERSATGDALPLAGAELLKSKRYGSTAVELWKIKES